MQNNECIRAKWKGKSMDVFSSCYSSVSVDFVCDRYSLEESKCKKSFDFACDCSFMSGTMQQRRTQDDGSRRIVWRSISFFSWFTQESFGYGDSILILILGILSGGWNLLWILFAAFLIASVYGGIMIARKKYTRKNSFPFIPFLTVAYLGGMIGGVY